MHNAYQPSVTENYDYNKIITENNNDNLILETNNNYNEKENIEEIININYKNESPSNSNLKSEEILMDSVPKPKDFNNNKNESESSSYNNNNDESKKSELVAKNLEVDYELNTKKKNENQIKKPHNNLKNHVNILNKDKNNKLKKRILAEFFPNQNSNNTIGKSTTTNSNLDFIYNVEKNNYNKSKYSIITQQVPKTTDIDNKKILFMKIKIKY